MTVLRREWVEPDMVPVSEGLLALVGGQRLVAEILVRRGMADVEAARAFLNPEIYQPASAYDLPNMAQAVDRVLWAVEGGQRVGIWGDFDVDGQTATTLLVTLLRELGLQPYYYIPSRQTEGHGISTEGMVAFIDQHAPDLLITCDTGIAEHEAIALAHAHGVDVIVTDHHKLPDVLPAAYTCINPQMLEADHPLYTLPGVGCAYKLAEALLARVGRPDAAHRLLDLVALGIVADVAVLTGDTRYLLQRGLKVMQSSQRLGIHALCEAAGLDQTKISARDIGWTLGPRLNALGRLGDANEAVILLSTDDLTQARILANRLEGLNDQRKLITDQVTLAAQAQIDHDPALLNAAALVLAHPEWPGGVLGIVANRLVEQYNRPVVLIATPPGEAGKGSARSVEGVDITAVIASCSQWLDGYGGHTMAGGITIQPEQIPAFRRGLSRAVAVMASAARAGLMIDGVVRLDEITDDLLLHLSRLEPFGPGNPTPVLVSRGVHLRGQRAMGRSGEHVRLSIADDAGQMRDVVWWRWPGEVGALAAGRFDLAFTLRESVYKGATELLMEYVDARLLDDERPVSRQVEQSITLVDCRARAYTVEELRTILADDDDACIWSEGVIPEPVGALRRDQLRPARTLVVWMTPPDPHTLQTAVHTVRPERVLLFAHQPETLDVQIFVRRVAGLVKYRVMQRAGRIDPDELGGLTAQSSGAIRKALAWLAARGDVRIVEETANWLVVEALIEKTPTTLAMVKALEKQMAMILAESQSYRDYYATADKTRLFNRP